MNPHFPILREPIKVRFVHGPTSWILGDDSPIICQCFFFIPVACCCCRSTFIDIYLLHTPGWQAKKTVGFWNHRPWPQLSIAYGPKPPEIRPQISPNQSKSSQSNRLKRKGNKKVPTDTTVALANTDLSVKMGYNKFHQKKTALGQIEIIECLASQHHGVIYLLSFSRGTKLVAKWFE